MLFHPNGGSDETVLNLAPRISRRNFIVISLRGHRPLGPRHEDGTPVFSWEDPNLPPGYDDQYVVKAIEQTRRNYHIHSERVYLAGIGEGAGVAYRFALNGPEKVAGVVCLNGTMPRPEETERLRPDAVGHWRVFIGHGAYNESVPAEAARKDFVALYGAGVDVRFRTYPVGHKLHPNMLRDINRWLIANVDADNLYDADYDE